VSALGLERELSNALPSADAHRELAAIWLARGRIAPLGEELDALVRVEEGSAPPPPIESPEGAVVRQRVRPCDWLDARDGTPLEILGTAVLPLGARHAFVKLAEGGPLLLEACVVKGHAPEYLCVLLEGKHLGHLLVPEGGHTFAVLVPGAGWLEIVDSVEDHKIRGAGEPSILVRNAAIGGSRKDAR